jgi:hypothetical protein
VISQFIDANKDAFGVAPIRRALSAHGVPIAPRTYWAHRSRPPSRRALWDMTVAEVLAGIYQGDERGPRPPESVYGSLKMWAYLRRKGIEVARCTVAADAGGRLARRQPWVHWYNTSRLMHRLGRRPRQKPKPSTTLNTTTASRLPLTPNEARRK